MNMSDLVWHDLDLAVEEVDRTDAPEELAGVLAFGEPVVYDSAALAKAGGKELDPELQLLNDQHRFTYVRLALSIRPQENLLVRFVALDLTLDRGALCWSMEPMKVEQELKSKTEASISSKLKVKLAEVGAELGSDTKESAEYVLYQPVIEAFNVQRADPAWELRAAAGKQVSGIQLFHMVIKAPKLEECRALVSIRAEIMRRGFLFSYRARRSDRREEIARILV
jgi:hypothetical protein